MRERPRPQPPGFNGRSDLAAVAMNRTSKSVATARRLRARSRSAPSPSRPPPAARSGSGGGIADFAGSGGWNLTRVSDQIWATGAQVSRRVRIQSGGWRMTLNTTQAAWQQCGLRKTAGMRYLQRCGAVRHLARAVHAYRYDSSVDGSLKALCANRRAMWPTHTSRAFLWGANCRHYRLAPDRVFWFQL